MSTVAILTSELTGPALNWAAAKATRKEMPSPWQWATWDDYRPATNPSAAYPLLHKHAVATSPTDVYQEFGGDWKGTCATDLPDAASSICTHFGETPLIAGLRALVGAILGESVNVPTEILELRA